MSTSVNKNALAALISIREFLPTGQYDVLIHALAGEESAHFAELITATAERIENLPVLYAQEKLGDKAVVYLHYFFGATDAWITEKGSEGNGPENAFGFVCLNGDKNNAEFGYVSIADLVANDLELDLYWEPKTVGEVMASFNDN